MELTTIGIIFFIGTIFGFYLKGLKKKELNTDECINYLHKKGYYIKLSVPNEKE